MTQEATIEKMNEVIAKFMGWEFFSADPKHMCSFCFAGDDPCTAARDRFIKDKQLLFREELKYHSSWDALMNAWFILRTNVWQSNNGSYPADFFTYIEIWKRECFNAGKKSLLECHKTVYNAIEWYNQQSGREAGRDV